MIDRTLNYGRQHIQQFLADSMPFLNVLDLGAGSGSDLMLARQVNPHAELHAVECNSGYAAELVKARVHVHPLDIEHERLPFDDGMFDVILINQLLEHTKELFWIFHEMSRVLTDGGKIVIGVPNLAALHNRVLLALGIQPSPIKSVSAHIRGFTKGDILAFVDSCFPGGYELRGFGGSNFYPFPPLLARPLARIFPTLAWGIFFLLEKKRAYGGEFLAYPLQERLETNFYMGGTT